MPTLRHRQRGARRLVLVPDFTPDRPVEIPPQDPSKPAWPVTLLVVVCAYLLAAWNLYGAMISVAPFFGDQPSRDDYIQGGMAALTAVVPCVLLALAGWMAGSRWGLALFCLPAGVLALFGMSMVADDGDPSDPEPTRAVQAADLFDDLTHLNWIVAGGLAVVIVGVVWTRRDSRRSPRGRLPSDNRPAAR